MKESSEKNHWNICIQCNGESTVVRGPSRKRLRAYTLELDNYLKNKQGDEPVYPDDNLDICLACKGSGLMPAKQVTSVDTNYPHLAIVGAGIGGVALAVACLHRGIPFTLFEHDIGFDSRSQGYGLTLQQASKAVHALGIPELKEGITSTRHVVHNSNGKVIGEWGLRRWKKKLEEKNIKRKNIHIARQSLRHSMIQELGVHSIKWGHKFIEYIEDDNRGIDVIFEAHGKRTSIRTDLLIGADGIRSSVRQQLVPEIVNPLKYLGCIVILGICPLESLEELNNPLFDSATVFQTVNGHERIYVMPYDSDHVMWQLSFPMTELEAMKLHKKGPLAMKDVALKRLKWHSPIPELLRATDVERITGYPVYDRELLDIKNLKGRVSLIGDAAHPMSPFKGQGANQAILDALALARNIFRNTKIGSHWRDFGIRELVLNTFEKEMMKRSASKVRDSRIASQILHSDAVLHEGDEPRGRGITK